MTSANAGKVGRGIGGSGSGSGRGRGGRDRFGRPCWEGINGSTAPLRFSRSPWSRLLQFFKGERERW